MILGDKETVGSAQGKREYIDDRNPDDSFDTAQFVCVTRDEPAVLDPITTKTGSNSCPILPKTKEDLRCEFHRISLLLSLIVHRARKRLFNLNSLLQKT